MSLLSARLACANTLKALTIGGSAIFFDGGPFSGRVTAGTFSMFSKKVPSIWVAVLGARDINNTGDQVTASVQFGAFIVTKDRSQIDRDDASLTIVDKVLDAIGSSRWGDSSVQSAASQLNADNLYNEALDKIGLAIWAITWYQIVDLTLDETDANLASFEDMRIDYNLAESDEDNYPDAQDQVTLEGIP